MLLVVLDHGLARGALPTVAGEIGGELKLFARDPEFVLPWKFTLGRSEGGEQAFSYKVDAASTKLDAAGRMNLATGDGSWRIEECRVDAAVWLSLLAPRLGSVLAGASAQGVFTISGDGTLHNGEVTGRIKCEWRDGVLVHAEQGWKLEGIAFSGEFAIDAVAVQAISTAPFELKIGTITHPRFGARKLAVNAVLTPQRSLQLTSVQVEIAGGELFVDPAEVPLVPLVVDLNMRFQRVGLQDIVLFVPTAGLADARGRIDGEVRLKWREETDFQVGVGHLAQSGEEPTVIRLTPSLGLLTGRMTPYVDFSETIGKTLGRLIRAKNPAYDDLQKVELGKSELSVSALRVLLTPDGDERGRSATVQFVARPMEKGSSVKEVKFDVNVVGPLNRVLKVGSTQEFSINAY